MYRQRLQSAFTLIELSIVLVIIGLIIGGVLVGKDLIQAAKIRAIISERDQFETAFFTYKLKYNGLPGDIINATSFWGSHATGAGAVPSTDVVQTGTFNGNGNGQLSPVTGAPYWAFQEPAAAWQQLANAGLIAGQYNAAMTAYQGSLVSNFANLSYPNDLASPKSKLGDNLWWAVKYVNAAWLYYPASTGVPEGHVLILRRAASTACGATGAGSEVLKVSEMKILDQKIDDGMPISGKVMVPNSNALQSGSGCFYGEGVACIVADAANWNYNLPVGANYKSCMPIFRTGF